MFAEAGERRIDLMPAARLAIPDSEPIRCPTKEQVS
jgi:hypothetical protein